MRLLPLAPRATQMDDIKSFRQWGSQTPGHPENFITKGVEVTTGTQRSQPAPSAGTSGAAATHMEGRVAYRTDPHTDSPVHRPPGHRHLQCRRSGRR